MQKENQLEVLVKGDGVYKQLLSECLKLEKEYKRILDLLSQEDRKLLEAYISCCEEMESRRTYLALYRFSDVRKEHFL